MKYINLLAILLTTGFSGLAHSNNPTHSLKCHKNAESCRVGVSSETCEITYENKQGIQTAGYRIQIEKLFGAAVFGNGKFLGVRTDFRHRFGWGDSEAKQEDVCSTVVRRFTVKPGCTLTWRYSKKLRNPIAHEETCPDPRPNRGKPVTGNWG